MKYCREIERKYTVEDISYSELFDSLNEFCTLVENNKSHDLYWRGPNVDFIRLRENSRELTVKVTDKGSIVDRIEENVLIDFGNMETCTRLVSLLFGAPKKLVKYFSVFGIGDGSAVVCLYTVENDPLNRVFLEVEADCIEKVDGIVSKLPFIDCLIPETKSLFNIFFGKGE